MRKAACVAALFGFLVAIGGSEVAYINGPVAMLVLFTGATTALFFSAARAASRGLAMTGHGTTDSHDDFPDRFSRLSEKEKDDIAQMVFDRLFVWAGRSVVKKVWLGILAVVLGGLGWIFRDHIK